MKLYILILFLVIPTDSIFSQNYQYIITNVTDEIGIPGRSFQAIAHDADDNIWIGVSKSLYKYDAHEVTKVAEFTNKIMQIDIDSNQNLWIKTLNEKSNPTFSETIIIYNTKTNQTIKPIDYFIDQEEDILEKTIIRVDASSNGTILLKASPDDYYYYHEQRIKKIESNGLPLIWSKNNQEYISYNFGPIPFDSLCLYNLTNSTTNKIKSNGQVKTLIIDNEIRWYTKNIKSPEYSNTIKQITNQYLTNTYNNIEYPISISTRFMNDNDFHYIHNSAQILIYNISKKTITPLPIQQNIDLENSHMYSMSLDSKGDIWLATSKGIFKISKYINPFFSYLNNQSITLRAIHVTDQDKVYVASSVGIFEYDVNNQSIDTIVHKIYGYGLDKIEEGKIHVGTYGSIFKVLDQSSLRVDHILQSRIAKIERDFFCSHLDKNNRVWVGGSDGLFEYDPSKVTLRKIELRNGYIDNYIMDIIPDKYEPLLYCLSSSGLIMIDVDSMKYYLPPELIGINISSISQDIQDPDVFWLGTRGSGLVKWDKTTSEIISWTLTDGMSDNNIHSVIEDDENNLWLSSDYGINVFNKNTGENIVLTDKHGIHETEMNRHSYAKLPNGDIAFGSINGLIVFDPKEVISLFSADTKLTATLTSIDSRNGKRSNKVYDLHNNTLVDIASNYLNPQIKITNEQGRPISRIRYFIVGIDDTWRYSSNNSIELDSRDYGKKNILVSYQNSVNGWSNPFSLITETKVPFVQSQLFYSLILFSFLTILFGYLSYSKWKLKKTNKKIAEEVHNKTLTIQNRNEKLKILNKLNEDIFAVIGHDLKSPLIAFHEISKGYNYLIKKGDPKAVTKLGDTIEQNSRSLLSVVNRLLDWSKSLKDKSISFQKNDIKDIITNVKTDLSEIIKAKSIEIKVEFHGNTIINTETESLTIILRNIIHNAIKYSEKTGVITVSYNEKNEEAFITIRDNGVGMNKKQIVLFNDAALLESKKGTSGEKGIGLGLKISNDLIIRLGLTIEASQNSPCGLTVKLSL